MLVKNHCKGPFDPAYIYDQQVAEILNDSMLLLITLDSKEKKCNIHHVKPVSNFEVCIGSQVEVFMGAFPQFQDSIKQNSSSSSIGNPQHSYNLQSKQRNNKYMH